MTEIAFHFNAPDRISYACRLLRKAFLSGARLVVIGESHSMQELDAALWTFSPLEFVPHCLVGSEAGMMRRTPVLLGVSADLAGNLPHNEVLVNLGNAVPPGFERFERVIEVVTLEDEDRKAARQRWKHYADRGYAIVKHDLAAKVPA